MIKKLFVFAAFLITGTHCFSQTDFSTYDFSKVDSFALTVKLKHDNYFKLAKDLTDTFSNDRDKVRAIFRWITGNIEYDYKTFNKQQGDPVFECKNNNNCSAEE